MYLGRYCTRYYLGMGISCFGGDDNFCSVPGRLERHGQSNPAAPARDVNHLPGQLPKIKEFEIKFTKPKAILLNSAFLTTPQVRNKNVKINSPAFFVHLESGQWRVR